ncbi:MAG TPA: BLUF domain-containing protein [Azospirillum sp.]|nr:BLUF domain-containing protein [Azospirillum sp.]
MSEAVLDGGWEPDWVEAEGELCRLIYFSRLAGRVSKADLKSILTRSRVNNARTDVTGALCFDNRYFLQILEGRRVHVNRVFARIAGDSRHCDVSLVSFTPVAERLFPSWSMMFVGADQLTRETCRRFCGVEAFRPERLTAERAAALVRYLAEGPPAAPAAGAAE